MKCRHCNTEIVLPFIDLGSAPPSNSYLEPRSLRSAETWYPLRVLVCEKCWLVQTEDFNRPAELFDANYAYFSSFSSSWLKHAEQYVQEMITRFELSQQDLVIEVAANDGYLLQYFEQRGIPCLGIEPTASTASAARRKGIDIIEEFFGTNLAERLSREGRSAALMTANNVLAHVPDVDDFVAGFSKLLAPEGVATFEFPHLMRLIEHSQFDTIYHEHFSYLSLTSVEPIFASCGLDVFDVEELSTHGGSLRVYAQRADLGRRERCRSVSDLLKREADAGMRTRSYYADFQLEAERIKYEFLRFLLDAKHSRKKVVGYGAAAKGNTLMNFAGIRADLMSFIVDRNPAKQGKYTPGSRIPIVEEAQIEDHKPDYIVILPWNLKDEVLAQLAYARRWGAKFVTVVPNVEIV